MEFRENEAIYLQIAAFVGDNILIEKWIEKIPSVRELAGDLQVNPNTVMRAYEFLQVKEIIINKRGIGLFVAPDAKGKLKDYRKERFLGQELPEFFRNISMLDISIEEIQSRYVTFIQTNNQPEQP
ncbi:DNA-binding transcriptional regulator YhcF (GntR family) [Pedobacter cryoconitis]|uniref:DNA-binding transcriptional regulator YhcF (GntR family) n=1 Tax=Pedobacter cryoconitis TaxID=188932 RepID=A0A7W8ZIS2_9SPHI|nr:GntR family transcriptional regulator [Pedobacter cryoconitis]MBB5634751.1 DNA-binding transcriptional regulator YhcF (GntR family) [Pedobacter cryoconitis]